MNPNCNELDPDAVIERKLELWEHKLLDLSLRNALLNLRAGRGCLPLAAGGEALREALYGGRELALVPWAREEMVVFSSMKPGDIRVAPGTPRGVAAPRSSRQTWLTTASPRPCAQAWSCWTGRLRGAWADLVSASAWQCGTPVPLNATAWAYCWTTVPRIPRRGTGKSPVTMCWRAWADRWRVCTPWIGDAVPGWSWNGWREGWHPAIDRPTCKYAVDISGKIYKIISVIV